MKKEMSDKEALAIVLTFLDRATLSGSEVPTFIGIRELVIHKFTDYSELDVHPEESS